VEQQVPGLALKGQVTQFVDDQQVRPGKEGGAAWIMKRLFKSEV